MTTTEISHEQELRLALQYVKEGRQRDEEYREAKEHAYRTHTNLLTCKHGTYIGDPYGPDYMCGMCESGEDDDLYPSALARAKAQVQADVAALVQIDATWTVLIRTITRFRKDEELYGTGIRFGVALYEQERAILAKYGKDA